MLTLKSLQKVHKMGVMAQPSHLQNSGKPAGILAGEIWKLHNPSFCAGFETFAGV
ncbi:MAG: hypothetical protein ACI4TK_10395 [Agathobacter sp.]